MQVGRMLISVSDSLKMQIDTRKILVVVCALLWSVSCSDSSTGGESARDAAMQIRDARVSTSSEDARVELQLDSQTTPSDAIDMDAVDIRVAEFFGVSSCPKEARMGFPFP